MTVRVRPLISNALLAIASTLLCYVVAEYAIFRLVLPVVTLDIRPHLPDIADVLTQNSKSGYLPRDYVALLGDSNAEGLGDWLLEANGDRTKPFHSANVIHEMTGRDVVTFGKGGAGSAEGIVLRPARVFPSGGCSVFPAIEAPREMFVYFYEGNDVEDNIHFYVDVRNLYGSYDTEAIDRYLVAQYAADRPWHCHLQLADMAIRMTKFLYQYYVAGVSVTRCWITDPHANRIIVGDRTVDAPELQGPAMGVPDEHMRISMSVLARSLSWLRDRFGGVPVNVVYVPSPISVYRHAGDTVSYCGGVAPVSEARQSHDVICDLVEKISAEQGMDFIDATPALRAGASGTPIHGPRDWDHLNEAGYRILGSLVASRVRSDTLPKTGHEAGKCGEHGVAAADHDRLRKQ